MANAMGGGSSLDDIDLAQLKDPAGIFDLMEVINAKRDYNAKRADHKVENRLKDDGKKC